MEDEIEVAMSDFKIENECSILKTIGLGPCIGIAFSYKGKGFMLHDLSPHINTGLISSLLSEANKSIPMQDRKDIHPIVAGGSLDINKKVSNETLISRSFVVDQLLKFGFGAPKEFWGKDNSGIDLYMYIDKDKVKIETTYFTGNEDDDYTEKTTVDFNKNT